MNNRWSGIFLGATVCVTFKLMFLLLGTGVGLTLFPFEQIDEGWQWTGLSIGAAGFMIISIALTYLIGGYISSRLHLSHERFEICFQGLASWAIATLIIVATAAIATTTAAKSVEKGITGLALLDILEKTKPKIITDMSVFKGKAVSTITLGVPSTKLLAMMKAETNSPETKAIAEKGRKSMGAFSLTAFFGLLTAVFASVFGAYLGGRTLESKAFKLSGELGLQNIPTVP